MLSALQTILAGRRTALHCPDQAAVHGAGICAHLSDPGCQSSFPGRRPRRRLPAHSSATPGLESPHFTQVWEHQLRGQAFHTGDHSGGYVIHTVSVRSADPEADRFDVSLWKADSNGLPSSRLPADFARPSSFTVTDFVDKDHLLLSLPRRIRFSPRQAITSS